MKGTTGIALLLVLPALLGGCAERADLDRELLLESLEAGRSFLLANQKPAGNFTYEYNLVTGEESPGDNQVRQAGALWGLASIHRFDPTEETRAAVLRGLDLFRGATVEGIAIPVYPPARSGRTGTAALVTLATIEMLRTDLPDSLRELLQEDLRDYVALLLNLHREDGRFSGAYRHQSGRGFGSPSPYSDGESLLALAKAARYAGYDTLAPLIMRAGDRMWEQNVVDPMAVEEDNATTKGFFQWACMAYHEIHDAGWDGDRFGERTIELAHWMIDVHHTLRRTRNTAYAHEGIITALDVARSMGEEEAAETFRRVVEKGLGKLVTWQVGGPAPNRYLRNHPTDDPMAVGGVLNKKDEPTLRIDVTQHQMHAVILALKHIWGEG